MGGPNCHCILQIRSYAGEVELRQSRCAGMLVVFSEENTYLLSCLATHFGYLLGPREVKCPGVYTCPLLVQHHLLKVQGVNHWESMSVDF